MSGSSAGSVDDAFDVALGHRVVGHARRVERRRLAGRHALAGASVSITSATADTSSPSRRFITRTPWEARP